MLKLKVEVLCKRFTVHFILFYFCYCLMMHFSSSCATVILQIKDTLNFMFISGVNKLSVSYEI